MSSLLRRRSSFRHTDLPSPVLLGFASDGDSQSSLPSVFDSPSNSRRRRRSSSSIPSSSLRIDRSYNGISSLAPLFLLLFVALLPWCHHIRTTLQYHALHQRLSRLQLDNDQLQRQRQVAQRELQTTKRNIEASVQANTQALATLSQTGAWDDTTMNNNAQEYEDALLERVDMLVEEIPRASSRALKQAQLLFQTIRVEIVLAHNGLPQKHLIVELAPTTIVPHAVETFVRNVEYYQGWTLHASSVHHRVEAVQAVRPGLYVSTTTTTTGANLQVAVPEYAPDDVPVKKYALVYKDHGPGFGIVMDEQNIRDKATTIVIGYVTEGREILDYMYERGGLVSVVIEGIRIVEGKTPARKVK